MSKQPLPDQVLHDAIRAPSAMPAWVLRDLLAELATYREDEEHVHVAPGGGQKLIHSHPGGTAWHGYFGHPEDLPDRTAGADPNEGNHT